MRQLPVAAFALLLAVPLALACSRDLAQPTRPVRGIGIACTAAAQCQSGLCAEGVCCASACAAAETCAAPGKAGTCTARALGGACTADAQCPGSGGASGHCADGVCCESACKGTCTACALAGSEGRCLPAPANTDARSECGLCAACFSGICAPALSGTDPNARCGAGLLCGPSQTCGLPGGAACAHDADCAVGTCFAGTCEQLSALPVFADPMVPNATGRLLRALAVSPDGTAGLLFGEFSADPTTLLDASENELFAALVPRAGALVAVDTGLSDFASDNGALAGSISYLGVTAYVTAFSRSASDFADPCTGPIPCGLFGTLVSPGGQLGRREVIDAAARRLGAVQSAVDSQGRLVVAYGAQRTPNQSRIYVLRREVSPAGVAWSTLVSGLDIGLDGISQVEWALAVASDRALLVITDADADAIRVQPLAPEDAPEQAVIGTTGGVFCDPHQPGAIAVTLDGGVGLLASAICDQGGLGVVWSAAKPAGQRFVLLRPIEDVLGVYPLGLVAGTPTFLYALGLGGTFAREIDLAAVTGTDVALTPMYGARGQDNLADFLGVLDAQGLPTLAVVTGPLFTPPGDSGGPFPLGRDLHLVRYHP